MTIRVNEDHKHKRSNIKQMIEWDGSHATPSMWLASDRSDAQSLQSI